MTRTIVAFTSPVPMLRRGGHSQIWDEGTDAVAAFFARIVAAVDVNPDLEPRLAAADPFVRYAVFLADVVSQFRASPGAPRGRASGLDPDSLGGVPHAARAS